MNIVVSEGFYFMGTAKLWSEGWQGVPEVERSRTLPTWCTHRRAVWLACCKEEDEAGVSEAGEDAHLTNVYPTPKQEGEFIFIDKDANYSCSGSTIYSSFIHTANIFRAMTKCQSVY